MSMLKTPRFGKALNLVIWSVGGVLLLGALGWMFFGHLDFDDPAVRFKTPVTVVGAKTALTLEAGDKTSGLRAVRITFSQNGQEKVVLEKKFPPGGGPGEQMEIPFTLEPKALGFKEGKGTLTAVAWDRSWRNLFEGRTTTLSQEVTIDLVPVNVSFESVSHLLIAGGSGVIAYHLSKPVTESGVLIDGQFYRGYPNPRGGQGEYVVLFAVPQEGPPSLQVELVARPGAGQEVKQAVPLKVKPRKWRHAKLNLSDAYLRKVAVSLPGTNPSDLLGNFLEANRQTRVKNGEKFRQVCAHSSPTVLWSGAFLRFQGKPEAGFGDRRTYVYQNKDVDQETHLGADLASVVHSPVPAANNGVVVFAAPLGIYGNTVIIDHGLGVFSSYSHMSQFEVKEGDKVTRGQVVGHTDTTGLAGGDHLHFAVNLQGQFVDPVEWWDPHWLKDQVEMVWAKAGAPAAAAAQPVSETPKKKKPIKGMARHKKANKK